MCKGMFGELIVLRSLIAVHCWVQVCIVHQEVWPPASKFFYVVVIIPFRGWLYNVYWGWPLYWNCPLTPIGNIRKPSAALSGLTFYQNALSGDLKKCCVSNRMDWTEGLSPLGGRSLTFKWLSWFQKFQCFTVHFFISLNDKHQHNALHTQQ